VRREEPWAYVAKAVTYVYHGEKRVLVGYEYSRTLEEFDFPKGQKSPKDKIKLVAYDDNLDNPIPLFEAFTTHGRINCLRLLDERLFVQFFHSEDYAKGGFLEEGADGSMALKRLVAGKQQTSIDVFGDQIVIGSASPDNELRANELQLYRDTDFVNLPANRGV